MGWLGWLVMVHNFLQKFPLNEVRVSFGLSTKLLIIFSQVIYVIHECHQALIQAWENRPSRRV
jgi:hypothetical protein